MSTNNGLEWLSDRPKVHYGDCWREHHDCAIRKIEDIVQQIKELEWNLKGKEEEIEYFRSVMEKYDIAMFDDNVFKVSKKK